MDHDGLRFNIILLLWSSLLAGLAWVARIFSNGERPGALRLLGGILGASVASFSFGALAIEYWDASPLFLLGAAGPIGWMGGDTLAALAQFLQKRQGP